MKKSALLFLLLMSCATIILAQSGPKSEDVTAIKRQCGCHAASFVYAETFAPDKSYAFKDRYTAFGTEWVFVVEETPVLGGKPGQPGKIVIQHLLVANDSIVIKHWREDWLFENTALLKFDQSAS